MLQLHRDNRPHTYDKDTWYHSSSPEILFHKLKMKLLKKKEKRSYMKRSYLIMQI